MVTDKKFNEMYLNISYEMFKIYNKKTYPENPEMVRNFLFTINFFRILKDYYLKNVKKNSTTLIILV